MLCLAVFCRLRGNMTFILKILATCWRVLNFIRKVVMNLVFLFFVLLLVALVGLFHNGKTNNTVLNGDQGALWLNLEGYLADNRAANLSLQNALREMDNQYVPRQISTFDVVYAIEAAERDERIRGLVLDLNLFEGGDLPAINYIGKWIEQFKTSGKPVIALADNYSQSQYLLASYADDIYLNPAGQVMLQGMRYENLYFKSLLEKLDANVHIFRVGTYKSAVEPFLRNNMSAEAKANLQTWLGKMWQDYQQVVAHNREIPTKQVLPEASTYIKELKALKGDSTAYTKQRGLVTQLVDGLDLEKKLTALFGKNEQNEVRSVAFETYLASLPERLDTDAENKIAIINVEGTIVDGESLPEENEVGGDTIARLIRQANVDDQVKALILRVNSPGGSAFASEVIRQELAHLQQNGKPVVVSMGDTAASGGYWISSNADYIIADRNTVTGSIGIFAMFPTFEKTIQKIGVHSDGVSTSPFSEQSTFTALSPALNEAYQLEIEHGYDRFLSLVSKGRGLSKAEVDKVAQGQIWLGVDALKHKLVDELGDFDLAVDKAIELVNQSLPEDKQIEEFGVQWFVDEDDSLLSGLLKDLKYNMKSVIHQQLADFIGISVPQKVKQQLGLLNRFNDPKGRYVYCLNCTTVR